MSLNWRTLGAIPYLRDYAAASKREADTKPIRGDKEKPKPLGRRDQKYRHIKRMEDNSIAIFDGWHLDETPRIQFFENGVIHILSEPYGNKASYNEVITEVMGVSVHTELGKAWIKYDGGIAPLASMPRPKWVDGKGWVPPTEKAEPSMFRRNEGGRLVYINPPVLTTHVVSRKGAKAVRTRYMSALTYIDALVKLRKDDKPLWHEIERAFPEKMRAGDTHWQNAARIPEVYRSAFKRAHAFEIVKLMDSDEPGDHYKAYLWLQWGTQLHGVMENAERVLAWVYRDEWFTKREGIVGQKVHDRHAWAFHD